MAKRIAVVVSQGLSQNPVKRDLEENIIAGLLFENGIDVTVIPNLYDLDPEGTGMLALQGIKGNMIVVSWLYNRAAHWILNRNGIGGHVGATLLEADNDDEDEDEDFLDDDFGDDLADDKKRVEEQLEIPDRKIYCLTLNNDTTFEQYIAEIKRIATENTIQVVGLGDWVQGEPSKESMERFQSPSNDTHLSSDTSGNPVLGQLETPIEPLRIEEGGNRRCYPVIDFSRCTNCMECIDFCLFGVYGVDQAETILVEQPDNCRKGCPACSRVCPENAIIFPQHKTPAIAGAEVQVGALKIDLSQLFGAPSAVEIAAQERDEQLVIAGRDTVGMEVGIPKRQADKTDVERDELDDLVDELDALDI